MKHINNGEVNKLSNTQIVTFRLRFLAIFATSTNMDIIKHNDNIINTYSPICVSILLYPNIGSYYENYT